MLRARSLASRVILAGLALLAAGAAPGPGSRPARAQPVPGSEAVLRQALAQGGEEAGVARYNLAQWLWRAGRHAEAVALARESLRLEPEGPLAAEARVVLCQARAAGAILLPAAAPLEDGPRPRVLHHEMPVYSGAAREAKAEGAVVLEATVDLEGCVQQARLLRGVHPDLDQAALDAFRQWVFEPARWEDEPVAVSYSLTVGFQSDSGWTGESWPAVPAAPAAPAPAAAAVPTAFPIHGRVVGPDGGGVSGALVELRPVVSMYDESVRDLEGPGYTPPVARTLSGADGSYVLWAPSGSGLGRVLVRAPGHVPMQGPPLVLEEEARLPLLRLERDLGLRLWVQDGGGRPVAGARVLGVPAPLVQGSRELGEGGWTPMPRLGVTAADGSVTLARAKDEVLRPRVIAPLHPPQWGPKAPCRVCRVKLAPGLLATVRVQSAAGPLPDLVVRDPESGLALDQRRAGAGGDRLGADLLVAVPRTGRAAFEVLSRDGRRARLGFGGGGGGGGGGGEEKDGDSKRPPRSLALRSVRLPAAGVIAGQVVDGRTRRPVPNAYAWPQDDPGAYVRADGQGRFRIEGVEAYRWALVTAAAPGHAPGHRPYRGTPEAGASLPAIDLQPTFRLAGIVVDGSGRPLAGAEVRTAQPKGDWSAPVSTDPAGRFLVPGLEQGVVDVRVTLPGFAPGIRLATPGQGDLRVVLRPGHTAFGVVEDEDGKPLPGVKVEMKQVEDEGLSTVADRWVYRTTTGPGGRFELASLPAGPFTIYLDSPAFGQSWSRWTLLEEEARVDLGTFRPQGPRITGRVVDPQGKPVSRARIWTEPRGFHTFREREAALSDEAGAFSVPAPLEGGVFLEVERQGYGTWRREAYPSAGPVEVVLFPAAKITGRVLSPQGRGIAGARVQRAPLRFKLPHRWYTTDAEGYFELPELEPGEVELEVTASGYLPGEKVRIGVAAGQSVEGVEIVLSPGASLAGRVLADDGEPVFGASVWGFGASQGTQTDPEGRYLLSGLTPGRLDLQVHRSGFEEANQSLDIQPGENRLDWTLVRRERQAVRGRVLGADGSPAAGALVVFDDQEIAEPPRGLTGPDGAFEVLLEERKHGYTVRAEKDGLRSAEVPVKVLGAPVEGLELQLGAPAALLGRILGLPDEEVLLQVSVEARLSSGSVLRDTFSGQDSYLLTGLFPGRWQVEARAGWLALSFAVTVPPEGGDRVLDLDFSRFPWLFVRVSDLDGKPVPACQVVLIPEDGSGIPASGILGRDGVVTLPLKPGGYGIVIQSSTHELAPGEERRVTWTGSGSEIEVRVRPKTGSQ